MPEEKITTYDQAARVIHLYLREFCDETLPFPEMIADAARKANIRIAVLDARLKHVSAMATMPITN